MPVDEFTFYEDLIRDTKKTRLLHGLTEKKAEAMAQLIDVIPALMRENKETLWGAVVKQTMIRKNPALHHHHRPHRLRGLIQLGGRDGPPKPQRSAAPRQGRGAPRF